MNKTIASTLISSVFVMNAHSVQMASQPWVTNRIAEAEARIESTISTNNPAFVDAVTNCPVVVATSGSGGGGNNDGFPVGDFGGYGTLGALLAAIVAAVTWLRNKANATDTALAGKADATDLPYALVTPGEWAFGYGDDILSIVSEKPVYGPTGHSGQWHLEVTLNNEGAELLDLYSDAPQGALVLELSASGHSVTATRPSLPGHLCDRAGNRVEVSGDTTLTLPALEHAGKARDFYVRLTVSAAGAGSAVTWITAQGEMWDAMGAPPSSFAEGTHLYRVTEVAPGVWHAEDMFALAGKMPMFPMVAVAPSSGTLTVVPYTVATYTAGTSAAAFTVAVGTGMAGMARDCELVIDCTATGAVAPTVTWPSNFHPRTEAGTDFACEAGVRNVYFISEYATGEFAVGGWQETAGGNA
jgi:hypothetical protein